MAVASPLKTPLFDWHQSHGGRMVEFGGWLMPVQYSTIVEEHRAVRERVGLFDISHMGRLTFDGPGALDWIERVTTNHAAKLAVNQIQYSLMPNDRGGLIDDILVYRTPHGYTIVCNASNRPNVVPQLEAHREGADANFIDRTLDTAMIAVQGPLAAAVVQPLFDQDLGAVRYYRLAMGRVLGDVDTVVSRTGYTGEDGLELIVPAGQAERVWAALLESGRAHGIIPCGLGARDTLRFEAAMPLYGHELADDINPYAAGLGWAVKLDKGEFVGREALRAFRASPGSTRVGLRLDGKRIARQGAWVLQGGVKVGEVTSGTFAPTLQASLAMALVETAAAEAGTALEVDVRGHSEPAKVVPLPFYRRPAAS
ncbi:Glycine cleavage system T protein [Aquisphaera giovannonii]|uniref:Aminomethyltransferase n=1 Tax=Aquisphaera giovannonii TaxID=406548 RepID=A0A5B9VWN1_9BACT|nr:glycine cleavage system aminomethyltransferase GcvT [Aquisphaera giovannonii]QEH32658.1 Glycine cleavage system T protein [Aquisphaera giovannonii]